MRLVEVVALAAVTFGLPAILGWLFLFRPKSVVKFHATMQRSSYKMLQGEDTTKIDERMLLPTDKFVLGSRKFYLNEGVEHPEKFPRFINSIRMLGCAIWAMLFVTLLAVAVGILSGKATILP